MPTSESTAAVYTLRAHAQDECTSIEILDGNQRPVALPQSLGEVAVQLPAGVYAVRFYQGRRFVEKLAVLSAATAQVDITLGEGEAPEFATAAPVSRTTTTHEWQSGPALSLSQSTPRPPPPGRSGGARLFLFLRNPFTHAGQPPPELPAEITVHDLAGEEVFNLAAGDRNSHQQWMGAHLELAPGEYRVRRQSSRRTPVEQIVPLRMGWQTQLFLMTGSPGRDDAYIARISILMARSGAGFDFNRPDLRWTESALRALHTTGNIPGSVRNEMLWAKFENPMLGLYAGWLHLRRQEIDVQMMHVVISNLLDLVGPLPDVLALGWALALRDPATRQNPAFMAKLHVDDAYATPPMLRASWDHLLRASAVEPGLIPPGSLADRIGGRRVASGPWLAWRADLDAATPIPSEERSFTGHPKEALATNSRSTFLALNSGIPKAATPQSPCPLPNLFSEFFKGTVSFTLKTGLPQLASALTKYPEARHWLRTPRYTDLERRVAYWLQPSLDPKLQGAMESDPKLRREWTTRARQRLDDPAALLIDLGISSTTALRAAWGVFSKLFLCPILPTRSHLDTFVAQESRDQAELAAALRGLARTPSGLCNTKTWQDINTLEFLYLYYHGSPSEGANARADGTRLAQLLAESGFDYYNIDIRRGSPRPRVFIKIQQSEERKTLTAKDIEVLRSKIQQELIRVLEAAERRGAVRFEDLWQLAVLPLPDHYVPGSLLPAIVSNEGASTSGASDVVRPVPAREQPRRASRTSHSTHENNPTKASQVGDVPPEAGSAGAPQSAG